MPSTSDPAQLSTRLRRVYDLYRTSLLNRLYYAKRLETYKRWNMGLEIAIAFATSSTVGAWALWSTQVGHVIWGSLGVAVTAGTIVKPFLSLPKQIERYTKLHTGHTDLYLSLQQLISEVRETESFDNQTTSKLNQASDRYRALAADDDPTPNEKLVRECYEAVKKQIPEDQFWLPPLATSTKKGE